MSYKSIDEAIVSLAARNGAINRTENKQDVMGRAWRVIYKTLSANDVVKLDKWLYYLSPEELETFVDGQHDEMQTITATSPIGANGDCVGLVFEKIFEVI